MVEQVISSIAALAAARWRRWPSDRPSGKATRSSAGMRPAARLADEVADADEKLAGRELGERHRGDGPWRNAFGQHQRDAAGHDGGLAGTGTGFDQERAIVNADRSAPRDVIGEGFQRRVHY